MITVAAFALAGCLAMASGSDQIRAADLLPAFPQMAALPADLAIAPAPAPGVMRVFRPPELRRLQAVFGLASAPQGDVCIEYPVAKLEPERLLAAMQREFPEARIELLDFSRQPAPHGTIEFPKAGLRAGPVISAAGSLWTGSVRYGVNHRFSIWARAKVVVRVQRVVAQGDLRPGEPITAGQVTLAARDEAPAMGTPVPGFAESIDAVIGKCARQPIRAGEAIRSVWLQAPRAVMNGETVKVAVREGGAQLELEARAESSGAVGEIVYVRNPSSHVRFRARVEGPGKVAVDAAGDERKELKP